MSFAQTLDAEAISNEFELQPGQSVDYLADTTDLADAVLSLEFSANGSVWKPARDAEGALVADVVGSAGAESSAAVLRNESTMSVRYRAVLVEVFEGTLAGEIVITFTGRADPAKLEDVVTITDEGVTFLVPFIAGTPNTQNPGRAFIFVEYADNAAALAGGLVAGDLFILAATQAVTLVVAA